MMSDFSFKAVLMDMDGVLYHGPRALPYASRFVQQLKTIPLVFVTNNPILSAAQIHKKLQAMGFDTITPEQIITSAMATARWLQQQNEGKSEPISYFAVGASGLHHELQKVGHPDPYTAKYVIVGEGEGISFEQITCGINLIIKQHAILVGTNPDVSVDDYAGDQHRILPGGGALIAPFSAATGISPVFIGKPSPLLYQMALQQVGVAAADALMIGDRPDTDIHGAALLGMQTALVRTGRFLPGEKYSSELLASDYDCANLESLALLLGMRD